MLGLFDPYIYIKWIFDSECIYSFYKDKYKCDERKYTTMNIRSKRQMSTIKKVVIIFNVYSIFKILFNFNS